MGNIAQLTYTGLRTKLGKIIFLDFNSKDPHTIRVGEQNTSCIETCKGFLWSSLDSK